MIDGLLETTGVPIGVGETSGAKLMARTSERRRLKRRANAEVRFDFAIITRTIIE